MALLLQDGTSLLLQDGTDLLLQATSDPYYANVVVLLPLDADSLDAGPNAETITETGNYVLSSAQSKWGTNSGHFPTTSSLQFPTQILADANWGVGDFTVEMWYYPTGTAVASDRLFMTRNGDIVPGFYLAHVTATTIQFALDDDGSGFDYLSPTVSVTSGAWNFISVSRVSGTVELAVGGTVGPSTTYATDLIMGGADTSVIGGQTVGADRANQGYISDFRLTAGVGRYSGNYTVPVSAFPDQGPSALPVITVQPTNQSVEVTLNATFTVAATGTGTLLYQWYETTAGLLSGETASSLVITTVQADDGKSYYVIVTDDVGNVQSVTATLEVTLPAAPTIDTQPVDQFSLDGELTTYTVTASGAAPLTYQWYETTDGLLGGETSNSYAFNPTAADTGDGYYVIVTDTYSQPTQSNTAALTIVTVPTVITDPLPQTVIEYRDATFTTAAIGNTPFVYDWYGQTAGLLEAAGTTTFVYAPVLADDGELVYCQITDVYTKVTDTADALLTVVDANHPDPAGDPLLDAEIAGPADVSTLVNNPVTLSVTITPTTGVAPYTVDWYNSEVGLYAADAGESIEFPADDLIYGGSKWWVVIEDSQGYYGQSGQANMAILGAQLELSWSITDGSREQLVIQYQSIAWSLYDAKTAIGFEDFTCPVRTHRGISADDGHTYWIPFYDKSARCQRGPLVNDKHNRYYWSQDDQDLKYDTLQNLEYDSFTSGYDVGVPPPSKVVAVSAPPPTEGSSASDETLVTRAYVYTYVTIYGEEGPPSAPTTADGIDTGIWKLSNMLTGPDDDKRRKLSSKKIYRTVPSITGTAEFHFVASVSVTTTIFNDDAPDDEIALNYIMESTYWFPPPEGLSGLTAHPNGFFIGYVGRDIYFSEPYRPHAWNPNYTISTLGDVIGLGIFGTTVVVCTSSFPHTMNGIHPAAIVVTQHDTPEPCLSRYGIVSMPFGVYYPGPNGLMLASSMGFSNATKNLMTKEEWQNRYQVKTFDAARYQSQYVAFYSKTKGIMFAPDEKLAALVDLDLTGGTQEPDQQDSIFTDEYSGKTYLLSSCDMFEWNPVSGAALEFDWTSMEFDASDPVNFGASRIIWYSNYTPPTEEETWAWRLFSTSRMAAAPLMPMNFNVTNGVNVIPGLTYDFGLITDPDVDQVKVQEYLDAFKQIKQAFHWGPLVWTPVIGEQWPNTPYVIMELIANEQVVFTKQIGNTNMFRLPAGFKATRFKIRLRSNINIQSVKIAETGKELAGF